MPSKRPPKSATTTTSRRNRPLTTFTLSPEARAMVVEMAERHGISQSAFIELLIRRRARRDGIEVKVKKKKAGGATRGRPARKK